MGTVNIVAVRKGLSNEITIQLGKSICKHDSFVLHLTCVNADTEGPRKVSPLESEGVIKIGES